MHDGSVNNEPKIPPDESVNPDGLSYEELLSELLTLNGRLVRATVFGLMTLGQVAYFEGRADSVSDVRHAERSGEGEAMKLAFRDEPHYVVFEARTFSHAGYVRYGAFKGVLAVTSGVSLVWLDGRDRDAVTVSP
jgi:hypothetical protein